MELRIELLKEDLTEAKYYWTEDNKTTTWHFTKECPFTGAIDDRAKHCIFFRVDDGDWQVITGTSTFLLLHKAFTDFNFNIPLNERDVPIEECPATPLLEQHLLLISILFNHADFGIVTPTVSMLRELEGADEGEVQSLLDKAVFNMERRVDRLLDN